MERLHVARFESPIGEMRVARSELGLAYLELPQASGRGLSGWIRRFAPGAQIEEGYAPFRTSIAQLLEYFDGKRQAFDIPLDLRGTPFQGTVYEALARIPYGHTRFRTYGSDPAVFVDSRDVESIANGIHEALSTLFHKYEYVY
jgi:O6-methylguanine-DNA--protein-cysteine methyltransferase